MKPAFDVFNNIMGLRSPDRVLRFYHNGCRYPLKDMTIAIEVAIEVDDPSGVISNAVLAYKQSFDRLINAIKEELEAS